MKSRKLQTKKQQPTRVRTPSASSANPVPPSSTAGGRTSPSSEEWRARVAARAYELYAQRGYRQGFAIEDWLDAEREILSREPAT